MAEVNESAGGNRHKGISRSKKLSTRVDLTPMVDLGFLLITFFIFTSRISEPKVMKLIMPADGESSSLGESTALTVIPTEDDKIFYYHGKLGDALANEASGYTNYSVKDGLGAIIRAKQQALDNIRPGFRKELMLIIKPADGSKFENIVNVLDEVAINAILHYAIVAMTDEEKIACQKNLH